MDEISELLERNYGLKDKPIFTQARCLNSGTMQRKCDACVRVCHAGVYPEAAAKNPDYRRCEKCGFCASVCPGKAISPPREQVRDFLKALASEEAVHIACGKETAGAALQVACLAALSWEQLACLALTSGAILSLRPCKSCAHQDWFREILKSLDYVRRFVGEDLFFEKIRLAEEGEPYAPPGSRMSRRDLFTLYRRMDPSRSLSFLPVWRAENDAALFYAALLRDLVKKRRRAAAQPPTYVLPLPAVNGSCHACGVCAKKCPTGALSFRPLPDEKQFAAVVEAWKCTACGRCAEACREKAISGLMPMRLTHLGPVAVRRNEILLCSACGKSRKPSDTDGLCGLCRILKKAGSHPKAERRDIG